MKKSILFLTMLILVCACGKSEKQIAEEKATTEAIAALKKLSAATEVGTNYQGYGILLIEAKAKANESNDKIQNDELKKSLNEAMQGYQDAQTFWSFKIKNIKPEVEEVDENGNRKDFTFDNSSRKMSEIVQKYLLKPQSMTSPKLRNDRLIKVDYSIVDADAAMQACWLWAGINLNKADEIIKNN